MSMLMPRWFDYIVWDYSDPMNPVFVKLKDDTPDDIREEYEEYVEEMKENKDLEY